MNSKRWGRPEPDRFRIAPSIPTATALPRRRHTAARLAPFWGTMVPIFYLLRYRSRIFVRSKLHGRTLSGDHSGILASVRLSGGRPLSMLMSTSRLFPSMLRDRHDSTGRRNAGKLNHGVEYRSKSISFGVKPPSYEGRHTSCLPVEARDNRIVPSPGIGSSLFSDRFNSHRTDLEFGDLCDGIQCCYGQFVDRDLRKVERDKDDACLDRIPYGRGGFDLSPP